jgi:hypothetical protein
MVYIYALIFKTPQSMHLNMICLHEFASFLRNTHSYINTLIFKTLVRAFKYIGYALIFKTPVRAFKYDI